MGATDHDTKQLTGIALKIDPGPRVTARGRLASSGDQHKLIWPRRYLEWMERGAAGPPA